MDYRSIPIQNIINSGNIENSLNRIVQMQKMSGIGLVEPSTVTTPPKIVDEMLDALPKEIWIHTTRFLNIACKDGIFLVKIFQRLMQSDELKEYESDETKRAWHILENQLYAICVDEPIGRMLSTLLYGMTGLSSSHITWFSTLKDLQKLSGDALRQYIYSRFRTTGQIEKSEVNKYMQFDVVIGNPPYNKGMDLDFVDLGYKVSSNLTAMITPAKWQTTADDYSGCASKNIDYKQFRKLYVPHMSHVCFYPDCGDAFLISQVDGITWYVLDKDIHDKVKITNKCGLQSYYNSVAERSLINRESLHNIGAEIVQSLGDYKRFQFPRVYMRRYEVWTNNQLTIGGQGGQQNYLLSTQGNHNAVSISRIIDKSKGETSPSGASNCIFSSDSKEECQNFISWLNTKFTRFFVAINISKLTGILTDDCFRFVPAPPSSKFDHIYTDKELYKEFNLPQKYIDVIEAVIKERK